MCATRGPMPPRLLRSSSSLALIPKAPAVATASPRAAQTLGHPNKFALTMTRAEFKEKYTVKEIERDIRVSEYFRWCPFKKEFRSKDDFVNAQLFHSCEARYCKDAGNKTARASKTPSLEMNDKWIAWAAARLQIFLIDADVAAEEAADVVLLMVADEAADGAAEEDKSAEEDESDAAAVAKVKAKLPKWLGKCFIDDERYIVAEMNVQKLIAHAERQDLPPQYLLAEAMVKHNIIIGVAECNEGDFTKWSISDSLPFKRSSAALTNDET